MKLLSFNFKFFRRTAEQQLWFVLVLGEHKNLLLLRFRNFDVVVGKLCLGEIHEKLARVLYQFSRVLLCANLTNDHQRKKVWINLNIILKIWGLKWNKEAALFALFDNIPPGKSRYFHKSLYHLNNFEVSTYCYHFLKDCLQKNILERNTAITHLRRWQFWYPRNWHLLSRFRRKAWCVRGSQPRIVGRSGLQQAELTCQDAALMSMQDIIFLLKPSSSSWIWGY